MNLTKQDELNLNLLTEAISEQIGGVHFWMQEVETRMQYGEHRHSALQIINALGSAKQALADAQRLARNVVDFYYDGLTKIEADKAGKYLMAHGVTPRGDSIDVITQAAEFIERNKDNGNLTRCDECQNLMEVHHYSESHEAFLTCKTRKCPNYMAGHHISLIRMNEIASEVLR